MKHLLKIIALAVLALGISASISYAATILFAPQGGTGIGSATAGDIGKVLTVSNNSPFTYTLQTPSAGGGGTFPFLFTAGNAFVSTSTNIGFLGGKGIFTTGSSTLFTLLVNSSSTLQNFTFNTATGTSATTTNIFSTTASTTNLFGTLINGFGLTTCTGTNALTWTGGVFTCTAQPQGTVTSVTGTYPVQSTGGATPAISLAFGTTTANIWGTFNTFLASTTLQNFTGLKSTTTNATTTTLAVSTLTSCDTIDTGADGSFKCGTDSSGGSGAYPFQLTGNATSTLTQFNGGLTAYGSSTIGAGGTLTGLTVNGTATTTGNLVVRGTATSTIAGPLTVSARESVFGSGTTIPYVPTGGSDPSYIIINRSSQLQDASLLYYTNGVCNWEWGILGGGDMFLKSCTGGDPSTFLTRLFVSSTTGQVGWGTEQPTGQFEITSSTPSTSLPLQLTMFNRNSGAGTRGNRFVTTNQSGHTLYYYTDTTNAAVQDWGLSWGGTNGLYMDANANIAVHGNTIFGTTALNVNGGLITTASSTLQNFTALQATTSQATTTNFAISNIASGNCLQTSTGGAVIGSGSACGSGGGGTFPFSFTSPNAYVSTTTNIGFLGSKGIFATGSSTLATLLMTSSTTLQNFTGVNATTSTMVVGNCTDPAGNTGLLFSVCGTDNTTTGINAGITNKSNGTSAYSTFYQQNDLADSSLTHLAGLSYNSSKYTDTTFGTAFAVKNQYTLFNFDGLVSIISSTSTNALNDAGINFVTGGNAASNERARITTGGHFIIGTTTNGLGQLTVGSSTAPQLTLSSNTAGNNNWSFRNAGGLFSLATSTVTATSTKSAFNINANGFPAFPSLVSCDTIDTDANGVLSCGTDSSGGAGAYPFPLTGNATSTLTSFTGGLSAGASSTLNNFTFNTATGTSATTTNLFATTASSTNNYFTNATGGILYANRIGAGITNTGSGTIETVSTASVQGLRIQGTNATNLAFSSFVSGDGQLRFYFQPDGKMFWGNGTAIVDTSLARTNPQELTATSRLLATGLMGVGTTSPFGLISISTSTANTRGIPYFLIGSSTNRTLFTVAGDGRVGIGATSSPSARLTVVGDGIAGGNAFVVATSTAANNDTPTFTLTDSGYRISSGQKPVVSSCGTNPTNTGNNQAGTVLLGTGATLTNCTVTFNPAPPLVTGHLGVCMLALATSTVAARPVASSTTSGFVINIASGISMNANRINYQCEYTQ